MERNLTVMKKDTTTWDIMDEFLKYIEGKKLGTHFIWTQTNLYL